jgi:hypothetical protein
MGSVLSEKQTLVRDQLHNSGQLRLKDATDFVCSLNEYELEAVDQALARGDYFFTALENYRAETKVVVAQIEADFVAKHDRLAATAETIVFTERRSALGA